MDTDDKNLTNRTLQPSIISKIAELDTQCVKRGLWTNLERGPIMEIVRVVNFSTIDPKRTESWSTGRKSVLYPNRMLKIVIETRNLNVALPSFHEAAYSDRHHPWKMSLLACICQEHGTSVISFDSGLVDATENFGLNLRSHEKVQLRRKSTCTVLPSEGFSKVIKYEDAGPPGTLGFDYGPGDEGYTLNYGNVLA